MDRGRRTTPLLLLGVFLVAIGGLLSGLAGAGSYLPRLFLLAGGAAIVFGVVQSWSEIRFFLWRTRAVSEPGPALVWLLIGVILIVVSVGLSLRGARYDVTARRLNSLSKTSREVLQGLGRDVELIAAFRESTPAREVAVETIAVYRAASARILPRAFDPDREPEEARRLGVDRPDVLLVRAGDATEIVTEMSEAEITPAILRVQDAERPTLGVTEGHGETDNDRAGLVGLREILRRAGITYRTLRLGELAEVPPEISAVLVPGPRAPLLPGEVEALARFLERGGRAALLLEPGQPSGLEAYLAQKGIQVDGRRVRDESNLTTSLGMGPEIVAINRWGDHPVTHGLGVGLVLAGATKVAVAAKPQWGTSGADLVRTGGGARLLDANGDPIGSGAPLSLGAALEWEVRTPVAAPGAVQEKRYARLVVMGDADFVRDDKIALYGNRDFAGRLVGWITERSYLLDFPPLDRSGTPLRTGVAGLRAIFYGVEVLLPLLVLTFALRAWARRR